MHVFRLTFFLNAHHHRIGFEWFDEYFFSPKKEQTSDKSKLNKIDFNAWPMGVYQSKKSNQTKILKSFLCAFNATMKNVQLHFWNIHQRAVEQAKHTNLLYRRSPFVNSDGIIELSATWKWFGETNLLLLFFSQFCSSTWLCRKNKAFWLSWLIILTLFFRQFSRLHRFHRTSSFGLIRNNSAQRIYLQATEITAMNYCKWQCWI